MSASKESAGTDFAQAFRGELIGPEDGSYEEARALYNAMIDKRPGLIARCVDVADVISAVNLARKNEWLVAIRSGGHNGGGLGSVDDGLVIDLSPMRGIRVDPDAQTVRVEGGCTWGDVDHATHPFGLHMPFGIISTTGVGGLTLGGGVGHLTRKCGLTIDNLLAADVVLADGSLVRASADENPDLFWGLRGGGGNFGLVTSFLFRLHEIGTITGGPMLWHIEKTAEVMRWYREFLPNAGEDLTGFFAFLTVPPVAPFPEELQLKRMCGVVWAYAGPEEEADEVFAPIRAQAPDLDGTMQMPLPALNSAFDALYPPGLEWYWRADFVNELSDEAIARHAEWGERLPTMHSTMHLYPIDGAAHRVGKDETAWSYRESKWVGNIVGVDPDPANREAITQWTVDYWEAVHPYSAGGAYVNFLMEEGQERVEATYRGNYERLAELKGKYDPANLFRVNQNIQPKG